MSKPMIVGISGKIGTGKSTLAGWVASWLTGSERMSFACVLKDEVATLFNFPREWCDTAGGKARIVEISGSHAERLGLPSCSLTVRELLQVYGTDVVRAMDPCYWVKALDRVIPNSARFVVLDDIRFADEAAYVREQGGLLVRLDPYQGWKPGLYADHVSETALDAWGDWDLRMAPPYGQLSDAATVVVLRTAHEILERCVDSPTLRAQVSDNVQQRLDRILDRLEVA